jgi:GNAT superfamily N-acetyltransferase
VILRDATPQDEAGWRRLWAGYLAFYGMDLPPAQTDLTWNRLMTPDHPMQLRVACEETGDGTGGEMLGFALWQHHPSSWAMTDDLYLEDLFVSAAARGRGLGRALIEDLYALARARGFGRVYWMTETGNAGARRLYDAVSVHDDHIRYRIATPQ